MTRQPNELKKRSGAELRALAEQRAAAVGDPAVEARSREASFLSNLSKAQTDFEWIAEHEAWTLLGHDSLADWWAAKVAPVMSALSMRLTPEMATKVIEKVKAAEAHLPASQRHSARDLAALVGTSDWTARGRQDRDKRRDADHPDLENPKTSPGSAPPVDGEEDAASRSGQAASSEPPKADPGQNAPSDSGAPGSAAGSGASADRPDPAAPEDHRDANPGDEDGAAAQPPSDAQPPAHTGDEAGPEVPPQETGQADGRQQQGPTGVSSPAAAVPKREATEEEEAAREEREMRVARSLDFATGLVNVRMRLEPDPVRWYQEVYIHGLYHARDLPRVRDSFTPVGLRQAARFLEILAAHLEETGEEL